MTRVRLAASASVALAVGSSSSSSDAHVVDYAHPGIDAGGLELPHHGAPCPVRRRKVVDPLLLQPDDPNRGVMAGQHVDQARLARPVRTGHAEDRAGSDLEIQPGERCQATEAQRDARDL